MLARSLPTAVLSLCAAVCPVFAQSPLGHLVTGLPSLEAHIPADVAPLRLERYGKDIGARLIHMTAGEKNVRHAQPRWYGVHGYMTRSGRSNRATRNPTTANGCNWPAAPGLENKTTGSLRAALSPPTLR